MLNRKLIGLVLGIITLSALVAAGYFYYQVRLLRQDPKVLAQKETSDIIEKIGRLVVLPEGETPTLATVSDPQLLKQQQAFFAQAEKGDKVLLYTGAKKAILYSVSKDKIIDIAPLNTGDQKPPLSTTPTVETPEKKK